MLPRLALILAAGALALGVASSASKPGGDDDQVVWHTSRSLGVPWDGRLVQGVQLPDEGMTYFTWDPVFKRSPNRPWRRWGSDRLIGPLLRVLGDYAGAHPEAPRVGVGDLSRPKGGVFDERFGGLGHASHQNGLDVDVYYPRLDGLELRPTRPSEIDRSLAQDLVTRFVRMGAVNVFVGPRTGLRGPRRVVERLVHHDDHMHVRIGPDPRARRRLGRTTQGREIEAVRVGDPEGSQRMLVFGCIHGNECAGTAITRILVRSAPTFDLWVVPNLNPDGLAMGSRQNARGVDLNRNFPSEWTGGGRPWDLEYPGRRPLSEPETRAATRLIERVRPDITIWFHQPQALVRAWGPSVPAARRYARLAGMRFRAIRWPAGTAANWQNHRFSGKSAFVVELAAGSLSPAAANRHARAVLKLVAAR